MYRLLFSLLCPFVLAAGAPSEPLFAKGPETFSIQTAEGKTPTFRLLDKNASEKAVAVAVLASMGLPPADHVDVKVEELFFAPAKEKEKLDLSLKVNGKYLVIPDPVDRAKFLKGDTIEVKIPEKTKDVTVFTVRSSGSMRMKLDPVKNEVQIQDASGEVHYSSGFLGDGDQNVKFSGVAKRKL